MSDVVRDVPDGGHAAGPGFGVGQPTTCSGRSDQGCRGLTIVQNGQTRSIDRRAEDHRRLHQDGRVRKFLLRSQRPRPFSPRKPSSWCARKLEWVIASSTVAGNVCALWRWYHQRSTRPTSVERCSRKERASPIQRTPYVLEEAIVATTPLFMPGEADTRAIIYRHRCPAASTSSRDGRAPRLLRLRRRSFPQVPCLPTNHTPGVYVERMIQIPRTEFSGVERPNPPSAERRLTGLASPDAGQLLRHRTAPQAGFDCEPGFRHTRLVELRA
jgi:hypothetical protein